ncbi:MAG: cyclodeaminase/cyclohydrolase family protein [Steroidobacteraceae bacterium]
MSTSPTIANWPVEDLVVRISSGEVSPGAGAAGAVVLALAAACAGKAASVTLKHLPDEIELRSSLACLRQIARYALTDADRDSEAFKAFIQSRSSSAVARLVSEGGRVAQLIATLDSVIDGIEPLIRTNVMGDLVAARVLASAARRIQEHDATRRPAESLTRGQPQPPARIARPSAAAPRRAVRSAYFGIPELDRIEIGVP